MDSGGIVIVTGLERTTTLSRAGFPPSLLKALDDPSSHPAGSTMWHSNGEGLAEIIEIDAVQQLFPGGRLVPVCHLNDWSVHYVILTDEGLLQVAEEFSEPILGGAVGFMSERLIWAWETLEPEADQFADWADKLDYPQTQQLVRHVLSPGYPERFRQFVESIAGRSG